MHRSLGSKWARGRQEWTYSGHRDTTEDQPGQGAACHMDPPEAAAPEIVTARKKGPVSRHSRTAELASF